jgi:DNA-directed RNA polymerase subunit beta'
MKEKLTEYNFDAIQLKIASPEDILGWSYGEVIKPETINYRTQRPEKDGLFSERIFGPTKDWECYCGKYRRIRYKGIVCDKCNVEVTRSIVRRDRMGHIHLVAPCVHIWFLRGVPSKIGLILDIPLQQLERVVYYAAYVVVSVDLEAKERAKEEVVREFKAKKAKANNDKERGILEDSRDKALDELKAIRVGKVLTENEFYSFSLKYGNIFVAGTGGEAIRKMLDAVDMKKLVKELEREAKKAVDVTGDQKRVLKRLKLARNMSRENIRPEWMVITELPVLPPDLRPMVALDGGRFATSDLNDLYRRVINRNNRLKKLIELKAPEVIIINEKRMLQEAVDALIDNNARFGSQQLSSQRRPLRSLADMLKGKQGRFRQNLLGKRVDYSGRSVIVVGPELGLGQCGLPKKMALELFKPFVIHKVIEFGLAHNIRNSNRLIEEAPPEVWAILEDVIKDKFVLLNRAPTLHRLGIQAFKPVLIEDFCIRIPPMVCTAFNADFDGDQMAVHVPLTQEAQNEAATLMHSARNLLKPATGDPIAIPTQDIVLGCYYLTKLREGSLGSGKVFTGESEAIMAYEMGLIDVSAVVKIRVDKAENKLIETTVGRVIFNNTMPNDYRFINEQLSKKKLSKIVAELVNTYGVEQSADILDKIKKVGFEYATKSGITWSMDDLSVPKEKAGILKRAAADLERIQEQFSEGFLSPSERRAAVIRIWEGARTEVAAAVPKTLDPHGSIYQIIDSGARGSWAQPTQMMGMKGLVQNPKGETIELPVKSSFIEGFDVLEFFISTHGARKGTTDTALKTASAGYLTRRLIDVSQDVVVREADCRVKKGIQILRADGKEFGHNFADRLFSRTAFEDVLVGKKTIVHANELIDAQTAKAIDESGVDSVTVRSPITCKTLYGVCAACYGMDLGFNKLVDVGAAVGIIAAQAIGEPGTQLTMRTFHSGGVSGADITHGLPRIEELFEVRAPKGQAVISTVDGIVDTIEEVSGEMTVKVIPIEKAGVAVKKPTKKAAKDQKKGTIDFPVPPGVVVLVKEGATVKKGEQLTEGSIDLKELFKIAGAEITQRYVAREVQRIYVSEGASISNKHIEIIIRQMFARVRVKEDGNSPFTVGEIVDKSKLIEVNRELVAAGKQPAKAKQLLMGVTKVALTTESPLSAASFQETARILINAAAEGNSDHLYGLKENVIIGRLIPAGTGFAQARSREKKKR